MKAKTETLSFYEQAVRRAVGVVVSRLDEALDLSSLAKTAAMSPFHFHRVFRGMLGETPLELRRRLRLERAALALRETDRPVTMLAFEAGYETHEAFSRAFRDAFGLAPSAFRARAAEARPGCARPPSVEIGAPCGLHINHLSGNAVDLSSAGPLVISKGDSIMDVTIESRPAVRVAVVQHLGPYNQVSEAFARLGALAGPAGLIRPGAEMIALFHDDPDSTPTAELRSDAGLSVSPEAKLPAGLGEVSLPAGRYARTTFVGPYDKLSDAWARFLGQWLPASGERLGAGPAIEIYRNTPEDAPPSGLRTDLYVPLV